MAADATLVKVGRREIEITRLDKVLFPEDGVTKGDLIEYYARIAPRMLPHLRDRPLTRSGIPTESISSASSRKRSLPTFPSGYAG